MRMHVRPQVVVHRYRHRAGHTSSTKDVYIGLERVSTSPKHDCSLVVVIENAFIDVISQDSRDQPFSHRCHGIV